MRAAVINHLGSHPTCQELPDPIATGGLEVARVRAAAIKNVERMLVAGTHYASASMRLPAQVGLDAVAELNDGRRVYAAAAPPGGSMAERMLVDPERAVPVPHGVSDAEAAALPNAGVSAWLALEYAGRIRAGHSVLVLGATGVTGALATQLARRVFSAARVTAVGRDARRLGALRDLGADTTISIADRGDDLAAEIARVHAESPIDIVLDFLWGTPAEHTFRALAGEDLFAAPHSTRFVQIGEAAGSVMSLPAAALRSSGVELIGQGGGSVPVEALKRANAEIIPELFAMLGRNELSIDTVERPLADIEHAWGMHTPSGTRPVLVP